MNDNGICFWWFTSVSLCIYRCLKSLRFSKTCFFHFFFFTNDSIRRTNECYVISIVCFFSLCVHSFFFAVLWINWRWNVRVYMRRRIKGTRQYLKHIRQTNMLILCDTRRQYTTQICSICIECMVYFQCGMRITRIFTFTLTSIHTLTLSLSLLVTLFGF